MSITLTKRGAIYYARGTVAGEHIRESTQCRRKVDAEEWARRREREILARHTEGPAARLTLAEAALDYMNAGGEGRFLRPILEHFGPDYLLRDLDNAAVNAAEAEIYPNAKPATVNRQLITPLRAVLNFAAEDGRTPLRKLRTRKGDVARTRWLRPAEAEALLDHAGDNLRPLLACYMGTGARVSELLRAGAHDFHPATGEIWLDDTKTDNPRMLRMPARARDLLLAAGIPAEGPLMRKSPGGDPYTLRPRQVPFIAAFRRARRDAGLGSDVTPHVLRHTWATWYYAQTRDFGGLLDLGGWTVADMANRYRKTAPDDLAAQLRKHGWRFDKLGANLPRIRPQLRRA